MEPPKKRFTHLTEDKIGEHLVEKDSINTQNATRTAVLLYLHSHSCNNLFCFNNCGLFCLCYTKHLMTAPSGNIEILGKQNTCFPREQSLCV